MIISVSDFKSLVPTDKPDSLIETQLFAAESLIRNYTHNNFQQRSIRSQTAILDGKIVNPPQHIAEGDTIQITDSLLNNGLYAVESLTDEGMTVKGNLLDCSKNLVTKISYPPDVVMGVVNMMKWDFDNREKVGIQSETISRHSVTYFNMDGDNAVMGYPKSLMGFLKPYMKARF